MDDHNDNDGSDETSGAQKFVIVCSAIYTFAVCIINAARMLGVDGEFWQTCYELMDRYWFWIIAALGVFAAATWAAGQFNRRDVREDRLIEDIERRQRAEVRRAKVRKALERPAARIRRTVSAPSTTAVEAIGDTNRKALEA